MIVNNRFELWGWILCLLELCVTRPAGQPCLVRFSDWRFKSGCCTTARRELDSWKIDRLPLASFLVSVPPNEVSPVPWKGWIRKKANQMPCLGKALFRLWACVSDFFFYSRQEVNWSNPGMSKVQIQISTSLQPHNEWIIKWIIRSQWIDFL